MLAANIKFALRSVNSLLCPGCVDEKLNVLTPRELIHEEIPLHVYTADGQQIPYGLHVLLESMKKQYVKMVAQMQSKEYKENIQEEILKERGRKDLLTKRVKQLENQIDNLIQDSLGLLKARLRELGISADAPTEFIEKAKGIVCSHNDLQKRKGSLDAEVRKLEVEQEALITKKEKEILDAVLAQRSGANHEVNIAELRNMVKNEIKACLEGRIPLRTPSPLPKVGSDVTLTKVPGPHNSDQKADQGGLGLPKMEMKFAGMLEERARSETSDSQMMFGKNKAMAPRANDDYEDRFKKIITSELAKPGEKGAGQVPAPGRGKVTLSPTKVGQPASSDLEQRNSFLAQQRRPAESKPDPRDPRTEPRLQDHQRALHPSQVPRNVPMDPRYDPRGRPVAPVDPRAGHDPRIFDPRSQDPRYHNTNPRLADPRFQDLQPRNSHSPDVGPGLPRLDNRNMADHISSEIERTMLGGGQPPEPRTQLPSSTPSSAQSSNPVSASSTMSSQGIMNMTVERAIQNSQVQSSALRLSRVIEDSVRKDVKEEKKSIYAPNSRAAPGGRQSGEPSEMMEGLAVPRHSNSPGERRASSSLPQVEGLAARFDSYFEKEKSTVKTEGLAARFSSPDNPPGPQSRPNSTSSKSSLHTPDLPAQAGPEDSRKRAASPLVSPTPGKKPSRPASSSGEGSAPDEAKRCLDEINMGFDRLVSMASELDKRRKSAENSPNQTGSPRKGAADLRLNDASFDPNILAQKFKAGLMQGGGSGGGASPAVSLHNVRSPPTIINVIINFIFQEKPSMSAGPSFPGGNLPEHHFKKRYFNEEYQRQQKETERHLDQQRRQGPARPDWDRPGFHPGDPRAPGAPGGAGAGAGGYHGMAPRQLHPDQYRHPGRYYGQHLVCSVVMVHLF